MRLAWMVFGALAGSALGSFANVVASRVPRGESVVFPPSRCEGCGRRLRWWENVPVAAFLLLRGRCRTCGSRIGLRHFLVEAAGAAGGAFAASRLALLAEQSRG